MPKNNINSHADTKRTAEIASELDGAFSRDFGPIMTVAEASKASKMSERVILERVKRGLILSPKTAEIAGRSGGRAYILRRSLAQYLASITR